MTADRYERDEWDDMESEPIELDGRTRNPIGIRTDSKRRKKLLQKRLALGHKQDDHEEMQNYGQSIS